ncbi:MAG: UvrD-helicase domain-containing protein, partial [Chloroflexi bacterium]|nr:UvrD-helicase domain-containing protein [Chloroflexota bacterium]
AGPGSGKTTVLAARIAYLILSRQVPPTSILALTFGTKAARELRMRLGGLLGDPGRAVDVMTFHALGLRIVRQWSEELGFGLGPLAVYGDGDVRALLLEAIDRLGTLRESRSFAAWTSAVTQQRLAVEEPCTDDTLSSLVIEYEQLLRRRGAIDYPAMLALPLRLFGERPPALRLYQDAYRYVLVDEFQDVCGAQYELLRRLADRHHNLVAVGDPRQALYGWRGADIRYLHRLQHDFPETRVLSLDQNFRSTGRIVALANALVEPLGAYPPLWTDNPAGIRAVLFSAADEQGEAAYVASEIVRLESGRQIASLGEVAILYRTNRQASELIVALRERRLPYRVRGGTDLLARREVRDVIAYLRLAHNPDDAAALTRIANVPPRQLGRLAEVLRDRPCTADQLMELALRSGPAAFERARDLVDLIHDLHEQANHVSPVRMLDLIFERTGYRTWLASRLSDPTDLRWLTDLRRLAERAEDGLGDWLAELQLGEEATPPADDTDRVLLTTIHGAKGAEWPVVFVVGVEEGLLPHARATSAGPGPRPGGLTPGESGVDDELRIAYVAVTRPRERLYLTCCRRRQIGDRVELRSPSRFLRGIPPDVLTAAA